MKDHRMGEEICASIRVKAGEKLTAEEIKAFCKGKVRAAYSVFSKQTNEPTLKCCELMVFSTVGSVATLSVI